MAMAYEDMVAIGGNLNAAIQRVVERYLGSPPIASDNSQLIGEIAQAVLVQLDQAGYQITRK